MHLGVVFYATRFLVISLLQQFYADLMNRLLYLKVSVVWSTCHLKSIMLTLFHKLFVWFIYHLKDYQTAAVFTYTCSIWCTNSGCQLVTCWFSWDGKSGGQTFQILISLPQNDAVTIILCSAIYWKSLNSIVSLIYVHFHWFYDFPPIYNHLPPN